MPAYKDGKTWRATFYCKINGENKKINRRGFETKKIAQEFEREFLLKNDGSIDMMFTTLLSGYYENIENRLKYNTIISKKGKIKKWILPFLVKKKLSEITALNIKEIQNNLLKSDLKTASKNVVNSYLKDIFDYCLKYYNIKFDFVIDGTIAKMDYITERTIITEEQLNILLEREEKELYRLVMIILFWTGIRSGELLALNFGDFDLINKTLTINKSSYRDKKGVYITSPKSLKSNRTILINTKVVEAVERLKEITYNNKDEDFIFNLYKTSLYLHLRRLGEKCGIQGLGCHSFRHSYATYLIGKNVNPLIVAKQLGHSSVSMTLNTYSHILKKMENDLVEAIE